MNALNVHSPFKTLVNANNPAKAPHVIHAIDVCLNQRLVNLTAVFRQWMTSLSIIAPLITIHNSPITPVVIQYHDGRVCISFGEGCGDFSLVTRTC